jgi:hypothetical protein
MNYEGVCLLLFPSPPLEGREREWWEFGTFNLVQSIEIYDDHE